MCFAMYWWISSNQIIPEKKIEINQGIFVFQIMRQNEIISLNHYIVY